MKKQLLTITLVAGLAVSGFSQGQVAFQNLSNDGGAKVLTNGVNASGASVTLELFYGPNGSSLSQLLAGGTGIGDVIFSTTTFTGANAGIFFDGTTVTTTEPAGLGTTDPTLNVELAIAGWTGGAANYAAALLAGGPVGITSAFGNPTGGGGSPTSSPAGLIDWLGANSLEIGATPEPTTIALGGLGAAALLLFRRKK